MYLLIVSKKVMRCTNFHRRQIREVSVYREMHSGKGKGSLCGKGKGKKDTEMENERQESYITTGYWTEKCKQTLK